MKAKRYVIEALKAEGIKHVFMVPGGELDPNVFEIIDQFRNRYCIQNS